MNNKARGTRAENAVVEQLGVLGYDVTRSAASKGAADLVGIHDREIVLVQVKICPPEKSYQQPSPAERRELVRIARRCGPWAVAVVAQRHPGTGARPGRTAWYELTGPGPDERRAWSPREGL